MEYVGQNVNRVTDDHILGIRCIRHDALSYILDDLYIGLCQIQAGHAGFSGDTASDTHDIGVHSIAVVASANHRRRVERRTLIDIQGFTLGLLLVHVNQQDLRSNALHHQIVGNSCTHRTRTDHSNLTHNSTLFLHDTAERLFILLLSILSYRYRFSLSIRMYLFHRVYQKVYLYNKKLSLQDNHKDSFDYIMLTDRS